MVLWGIDAVEVDTRTSRAPGLPMVDREEEGILKVTSLVLVDRITRI